MASEDLTPALSQLMSCSSWLFVILLVQDEAMDSESGFEEVPYKMWQTRNHRAVSLS